MTKKVHKTCEMITKLIPTIINYYKLAYSCEGCMKMARKQEGKRKNKAKCKIKHKSEELEHKIIIISDSQAKRCAAEVKHNLHKNFEVHKNLKWNVQVRKLSPKLSKVCYRNFKESNE